MGNCWSTIQEGLQSWPAVLLKKNGKVEVSLTIEVRSALNYGNRNIVGQNYGTRLKDQQSLLSPQILQDFK